MDSIADQQSEIKTIHYRYKDLNKGGIDELIVYYKDYNYLDDGSYDAFRIYTYKSGKVKSMLSTHMQNLCFKKAVLYKGSKGLVLYVTTDTPNRYYYKYSQKKYKLTAYKYHGCYYGSSYKSKLSKKSFNKRIAPIVKGKKVEMSKSNFKKRTY